MGEGIVGEPVVEEAEEETRSGAASLDASARRHEAIAAFNRAWELIELAERSAADEEEMLAAAFASRHLWDSIGGDDQRAVGDWQIAHVASLLGEADLSLRWARRALERVETNGWTDWRLASSYEAMARAYAAGGDESQLEHWSQLCRQVLSTLEDDEDRELIASQLASIPARSSAKAGDLGDAGHKVARLDHVQLAMPPGGEEAAVAFYSGILGLEQREKPAPLAARGGCWFESGVVKVHLGVEETFRPALKAHPALVVEGLDELVATLVLAGHAVRWDDEVSGLRRCFVADPFGNRIELIEA